MKTFLVLLIVVIAGVSGWYYVTGSPPWHIASDTPASTDTLVIVRDSIINAKNYDSIPTGFYQGMLPCKTCEGTQRTIMFSGSEFKTEDIEWGKGTPTKKTEGTWEMVNGKILLSQNNRTISEYRLVKDSLIMVENIGNPLTDSLSRLHVLFKKNAAPENRSWKKRKSEGIDIVGNGSDPFWSIEIDNEKMILFKVTTSARPVIVPIEKPVITKDSTFYSIVTDAGAILKISIGSKFCNDGVSDHLYEYKMTVWYKGEVYKGCAVLLDPARTD